MKLFALYFFLQRFVAIFLGCLFFFGRPAIAHAVVDEFAIASDGSTIFPAGGLHAFAVRCVATFLEKEVELVAVFRVEQIFAEIADACVSLLIDADQIDLLRVAVAVVLEGHHCRECHHGSNTGDGVTQAVSDAVFVPVWLSDASVGSRFENDIAEDSVHSLFHLRRETIHDAIDHNEGRDAKGDRDDRGQGDPSGPEVTQA